MQPRRFLGTTGLALLALATLLMLVGPRWFPGAYGHTARGNAAHHAMMGNGAMMDGMMAEMMGNGAMMDGMMAEMMSNTGMMMHEMHGAAP